MMARLLRYRGSTARLHCWAEVNIRVVVGRKPMLLFLAGFLIGGLAGAVMLALVVAADEERWRRTDNTRTANRSREAGSSWVIAGNGAVTTGSRLGKFSVAKRRPVLPLR
jgi:hypothetical protein